MGMGYGANFAITIEKEKIEEMNLGSWANFMFALKQKSVSLEGYAISTKNSDCIYDDNDEEVEDAESLDGAFQWFQEEFKEKTGVSIEICYHSVEDEGDRYDQVDGVYFELDFDDVFQMTPQAKELQERTGFDWKSFVIFG